MQDLILIKPQEIVFSHDGQYFVIGKPDGLSYLAYPAIPILGRYFKTTIQARYFAARSIGEKRKEELVGYAYKMLPDYE